MLWLAFKLLMMADADIEDVNLINAGPVNAVCAFMHSLSASPFGFRSFCLHATVFCPQVLPALQSTLTVSNGSNLSDAQLEAVRLFMAEHRAAVLLFTGEESRVPYSSTKDGLKRMFMVARTETASTPEHLKEYVAKHWSFLQQTIRYKLRKAGKA